MGCGSLPAPAPRRIRLEGSDVRYTATTDVDWLRADRETDGNLLLRVDCRQVEASPAAASVLLTAEDRQPLLLTGTLLMGEGPFYLPLVLRGPR